MDASAGTSDSHNLQTLFTRADLIVDLQEVV